MDISEGWLVPSVTRFPPQGHVYPQEIAGPNCRPEKKGNQWVFIVPDHKGPRLFIGGNVALGGVRLGSHDCWLEVGKVGGIILVGCVFP